LDGGYPIKAGKWISVQLGGPSLNVRMCLANRNTDSYFYDTEMSWYEMSKAFEATGQKV